MTSTPASPPPGADIEQVIEPNQAWWKIPWADLVDRRDLLLLLFRRDHVARYKQTVLGPAWYVVQPLATAVIFSIVFGRVANISTDGAPRMLFYLCGLLGWNFFTNNVTSTSAIFTTNAHLFGKVYFPRLIVPLSTIISNLVTLGLQFGIFIFFLILYKLNPAAGNHGLQIGAVVLPILLIQIAALGLGMGLWISSLSAKYRDLKFATTFLVSSMMYLTPVIYPISEIPDEFRWAILLNPMAPVVETFRIVLLGVGHFEPLALFTSVTVTVAVLLSGIMVFQRTERTVVDTF